MCHWKAEFVNRKRLRDYDRSFLDFLSDTDELPQHSGNKCLASQSGRSIEGGAWISESTGAGGNRIVRLSSVIYPSAVIRSMRSFLIFSIRMVATWQVPTRS